MGGWEEAPQETTGPKARPEEDGPRHLVLSLSSEACSPSFLTITGLGLLGTNAHTTPIVGFEPRLSDSRVFDCLLTTWVFSTGQSGFPSSQGSLEALGEVCSVTVTK